MTLSVLTIMHVLRTNAWIHVVLQSLVENKLFVGQLHIDQFVDVLLTGLATLMMNVINVGILTIC